VAETHSSLFIRSIQTLVADGQIKPSDVALHWFTRDPDSGVTHITTATLDEDGTFGDWPEDFDDVQIESEANYLDAVARRSVR
jgi:predicted ATPase